MYRRSVLQTTAGLVALAFGLACAPAIAQQLPPTPDQVALGSWDLALHLSGGFAGMDRTIEVASSGTTRANDRKRTVQVSAQATEQELATMTSLVSALKLPSLFPVPTACNDCLGYTLEIRRGREQFVFDLDDSNLSGSSVGPLVNVLVTTLNRVLAGSGR